MIPVLLLLLVGPGDDQEVVGDLGEGDPLFLAVENVPFPFLDRRRLDSHGVAPGVGLGEAVGRHLLPLGLGDQVSLLLVLCAPRQEREAVETYVDRHEHAKRGVDILQLLAGEPEGYIVQTCPAVNLRDADAENVELGHLGENRPVEVLLGVVLLNVGCHLGSGEVADHLFYGEVVLGEIEVGHEYSLFGARLARKHGPVANEGSGV
jgi:hypothetical protein